MENSIDVHQKLNIELPQYTADQLLGIYPEKTIIQKDNVPTPVITADLFTMEAT